MLDTTHPRAIRALEAELDLERTLFVSASKSGSTLETRSHTDYFWKLAPRGEQWVAITDPGSELARLGAERAASPRSSPGEPTIGGRYSALSPFGLVPAALMGVDVAGLLDRACEMADACRLDEGNPGLELGLALGEGWREGRDKVCLPDAGVFGLWVEQLIAESTGKQGKGLVPAPGRVRAPAPTARLHEVRLPAPLELGQEFFRWEFATAVAGSILAINPFDQPDVQAAKDRTNEVLAERRRRRSSPAGSIEELLAGAEPPDYVCIQAFVEPTPENEQKIEGLARSLGEPVPAASSRTASGRATCTRPASCTRAAPTRAASSRWSRTTAPSCRSPASRFGFARLIRAQAAGDFASLRERGPPRRPRPARGGCLMQLGMIGLGRMGGNMTKRLEARRPRGEDVRPRGRLDGRDARRAPRPARRAAGVLDDGPRRQGHRGRPSRSCSRLAEPGDTIVDGGNSNFRDSQRRHGEAASKGIDFVDVGVSGGIWGLEDGYCLMVGGEAEPVARLEPIFTHARARRTATRTSAGRAPATS